MKRLDEIIEAFRVHGRTSKFREELAAWVAQADHMDLMALAVLLWKRSE